MRVGMFSARINDGTIDDLVAEARQAEADGFASFWASQIFSHDALTALAVIGREVPRIELGTTDNYELVRKIAYRVVGATATIVFFVYAVERAGAWVVEAIQSEDGAHTDGTVPSFNVSSGGGGGWD